MNRLLPLSSAFGLLSLVNVFSTCEKVVASGSKDAFLKVFFSCSDFLVSGFFCCGHELIMHIHNISFTERSSDLYFELVYKDARLPMIYRMKEERCEVKA